MFNDYTGWSVLVVALALVVYLILDSLHMRRRNSASTSSEKTDKESSEDGEKP